MMEPTWRYDVFLCFRGKDTWYTFTGNLYNALRQKRFKAFMDFGGMKSGDQISHSFLKALEESRISIIVLSQNFADSTNCLEELLKALECMKKKNQLVLAVFYEVDPSDVRHQTGSYGKAMTHQKNRFGEDNEKVRKWSLSLSEVADLSGWCFKSGNEYEYELIQKIVEWVTKITPRHDVFLSFSEKDTRYSFTGFLYDALCRQGFKTFMKGEVLEDEEQISQSLITSIEKSRLSIIVLSENYAYSSSCLDELVTILECMKLKNQLVWPIFYKVEPSDLRHQRNSWGKSIAEHENRFGKHSPKVEKWRSALSEVANLKGWHFKNGYEYEFIENIVEMAIKI